ncbi:MAG: xanthine dehydrogenase family protein subunit M [Gammaproteobacteria bacterium]|nr:xanthine dehydrogenase family protein subunit M [Gammaproteobacteria bacterium]
MENIEQYYTPSTLAEAVQLLANCEGNATLLAGGTDLMNQVNAGAKTIATNFINIKRIKELSDITITDNKIRIGALTSITAIQQSELIKEQASILSDTADAFASGQIRNSATIGGNLCNASPAGDGCIPLLALDAVVGLSSFENGEVKTRLLALKDFFVGPGSTQCHTNEILSFVEFDAKPEGIGFFEKFGTRPALDISIVSIGFHASKNNKTLSNVRIALGAVGPTPLRAYETEKVIENKTLNDLTPEFITSVEEIIAQEISPISDVRGSDWYRKEMVSKLLKRILNYVVR